MFAKPHSEHAWFNDLVGRWKFTHRCDAGPENPAANTGGTAAVRSLGGLWIVMECSGESAEGGPWSSIMTLGFDPKKDCYIGTFVGSMMTNLWIYEGRLDASGRQLILDVEGPKFDGSGMAKYQDIIEIVSRDHWILKSQILGDDGKWHQFMEGHHDRMD